ncbi:MAG: SxtJ family membrane protein [Candidatus Krumholzibacteria bacterium]|nr:SxtJ family membrane protein [Candidatus Krumholzibacteria bacterium]
MIVRHITNSQAGDTGLATVLVLLLIAHFAENLALVIWAIAVLVVTMIWPAVFRPLAYVWFTFANILRRIVSSIILTLVFVVIATPIGFVRRMIGADPMREKSWKNGGHSVFEERDDEFTAKDLERPY